MKIDYETTFADFLAYYDQYSKTDGKDALFKSRILNVLAASILIFFLIYRDSLIGAAIVATIVGIILYLAFPSIQKDLFIKKFKKIIKIDTKKESIEYIELEIKTDGLNQDTKRSSYLIKWEAINKIEKTESHIFIIMAPFHAFIIPIKGIKDGTNFDKFIQIVEKNLLNSKGQAQPLL